MGIKRIGSVLCVASLLFAAAPVTAAAAANRPAASIALPLEAATGALQPAGTVEGREGYIAEEGAAVQWSFTCEKAGRYAFSALYIPQENESGSAVQAKLTMDGTEKDWTFDRFYENEGGVTADFPTDEQGDERRPLQTEWRGWRNTAADETSAFDLSAGVHTLRLELLQGGITLAEAAMEEIAAVPMYADYLAEQRALHPDATGGQTRLFEGEAARWKSQSNLYPLTDRSSADTSPNSPGHAVINTIGGANWKTEGSWLEWSFTVPEDGFYTFSMRCRQNMNMGMDVYRRITVDGAVPFQELEAVRVSSDNRWQSLTLGGDEPYFLYLTQGEHSLRMTVTLGGYQDVVKRAEEMLVRLNAVSRTILSVTGVEPDIYRDYSFPEVVPELFPELRACARELEELGNQVEAISGGTNEGTSLLRQLAQRVQKMADQHRKIAENLSAFKNSISSLGTWVKNVNNQPLEVDYWVLGNPEDSSVFQKQPWWQHLFFAFSRFFVSFTDDYNTFRTGDSEQLTVWAGTGLIGGADQVTILRNLVTDRYTAGRVSVKLVSADALLPATLAQMGPDVALQLGEPLDYGIRHAVLDLAVFPDAGEVFERFHPSAYEPFSFDGKIYAVPETQSYPVMFYRTDILEQLGIDVSSLDTWEDILQGVLPELQKQYMDFGLMPTLQNYLMLLYQAGGQLYTGNGLRADLNSAAAVQAFADFTELYDSYRIPITFDFANRFRTGEMPIAIVDFTVYNQLAVFAPEIQGLWGMRQVPGTRTETGDIRRDVAGSSSGCVILTSTDQPDAAWEFVKWWTSADIQAAFGNELEDSLGDAARYPTANREALKKLKWNTRSLRVLEEQRSDLRAVPQVPGSYITVRYFDFAFRDVVYQAKDVRETLNSTVVKINQELLSKREEFHLPTE